MEIDDTIQDQIAQVLNENKRLMSELIEKNNKIQQLVEYQEQQKIAQKKSQESIELLEEQQFALQQQVGTFKELYHDAVAKQNSQPLIISQRREPFLVEKENELEIMTRKHEVASAELGRANKQITLKDEVNRQHVQKASELQAQLRSLLEDSQQKAIKIHNYSEQMQSVESGMKQQQVMIETIKHQNTALHSELQLITQHNTDSNAGYESRCLIMKNQIKDITEEFEQKDQMQIKQHQEQLLKLEREYIDKLSACFVEQEESTQKIAQLQRDLASQRKESSDKYNLLLAQKTESDICLKQIGDEKTMLVQQRTMALEQIELMETTINQQLQQMKDEQRTFQNESELLDQKLAQKDKVIEELKNSIQQTCCDSMDYEAEVERCRRVMGGQEKQIKVLTTELLAIHDKVKHKTKEFKQFQAENDKKEREAQMWMQLEAQKQDISVKTLEDRLLTLQDRNMQLLEVINQLGGTNYLIRKSSKINGSQKQLHKKQNQSQSDTQIQNYYQSEKPFARSIKNEHKQYRSDKQ